MEVQEEVVAGRSGTVSMRSAGRSVHPLSVPGMFRRREGEAEVHAHPAPASHVVVHSKWWRGNSRGIWGHGRWQVVCRGRCGGGLAAHNGRQVGEQRRGR